VSDQQVPVQRSQADQDLDRVIAAEPVVVPAPPSDLTDPDAHRLGMQIRGW
jgi:hypothetical protein